MQPSEGTQDWKYHSVRALSILFDVFRYIFSTILLAGSLGIVIYGIVLRKTAFWPESVPWPATLVIMFALLWILGILEGFQVAIVELCKNPPPEALQKKYPRANKIQKMISQGRNLEKFVLGRQVLVVVVVFFLSKSVEIFC